MEAVPQQWQRGSGADVSWGMGSREMSAPGVGRLSGLRVEVPLSAFQKFSHTENILHFLPSTMIKR